MDGNSVNDGDNNLHTSIADQDTQTLDQIVKDDSKNKLRLFVNRHLTERESYILLERYGCIDTLPKTIQVLSDILGISRERVRQIEKKAIEKLREKLQGSQSNGFKMDEFLTDNRWWVSYELRKN